MTLNQDTEHDPSPLSKKDSAGLRDSEEGSSPATRATSWSWVLVALLLPLATYGAYALTRDFLPQAARVVTDADRPAPATIVPQPEAARERESSVTETNADELPPPPAVAADLNLPDGAVVLMSFEKSSFYERYGNTYVRNSGGRGNDAVCDKVHFTAEGKCGGGLACQSGTLCLGKSLINHQSNYTITVWCRCDELTSDPNRIYASFPPGRPNQPVFDVGLPPERSLHVNAWNRNRKPDWWKSAATEPGTVPDALWCFLAVSLQDGAADSGTLTITVDDWHYTLASQMVDADDPRLADWLGGATGATIDELTVFQRALAEQEIKDIRKLGLNGVHLTSACEDRGATRCLAAR